MARGSRTLAAIAVPAALLLAAASASAAQRYASPAGSGSACAQGAPCDLQTAVDGSNAGDEVIVDPGDYNAIAATIGPFNGNTYVHGVSGQPAPRLHFTTGYLRIDNPGDRASYLQVDGSTVPPLQIGGTGTQGDQIWAHSTGNNACTIYGTLLDSVCWASGPNTNAISGAASGTFNPVLRNVTAWATGTGSFGIEYHASSGGHLTITAVNAIVHGVAEDIQVAATSPDTTTVNIDHSVFNTQNAVGTGAHVNPTHQKTVTPLFVNAASGDFREAPTSPTIDQGVISPLNGPLDLYGKPREINGLTDIGADEFDPFAGVALRSQSSRVKKRKVKVAVGCPAGTPISCTGTLTLTYGTTTAGSAAFSIPTGGVTTLKLKLEKRALKKLRKKRKLATQATAAATDGAGVRATVTARVKLKGRAPRI
jgi:hypothetical protein